MSDDVPSGARLGPYEIKESSLPLSETLRISTAIADALVAAYARGIIHRDLKPENAFLITAGAVKILDFGLAAAAKRGTIGNLAQVAIESRLVAGVGTVVTVLEKLRISAPPRETLHNQVFTNKKRNDPLATRYPVQRSNNNRLEKK